MQFLQGGALAQERRGLGQTGQLVQRRHSVLGPVHAFDASRLLGVRHLGGEQARPVEVEERIEVFNAKDVEALATSVNTADGVYVVPAFAGLGAPHWNQYAKGTMVGITRGTTAAHIARASVESIAYQTMDVLKAMEADSGISIKELRVDGGATANNFLMQFQADILNTKVVRPVITETTALGAAYLAGLAVGYWKSIEEIQGQWQVDASFESKMTEAEQAVVKKGWQRAIKAAIAWADDK